jgi:hypothetical protein
VIDKLPMWAAPLVVGSVILALVVIQTIVG